MTSVPDLPTATRAARRRAWWYRVLSDRESGSPRQILFLELARAADQAHAGDTAPWRPSATDWLLRMLLDRFGTRVLIPVLRRAGVGALAVYRRRGGQDDRAADWRNAGDGLLSVFCVLMGGLAAGFPPAGVVLVAWAMLSVAMAVLSLRTGLRARQQFDEQAAEQALRHDDPLRHPPEGATSLALIAISRGLVPDAAQRLVDGIVVAPDSALDEATIDFLCLRRDEPVRPVHRVLRHVGGFAGGVLAGLLPVLLWPRPAALWIALALTLCAIELTARRRLPPRPWQHGLQAVLSGGLVFLAVRLLAWLL
ncbi:VIT1/CCC1 transporter family protein [Chitinivorax sp. PXF-14]|uniref:VIT1/CCC1 transporter family protein n=1 Tax=Chitinivorax sp. PXF-14 TaxID=3230488 RepID=UPI0034670411